MDKKIPLSQLIRIGSKITKKCKDAYTEDGGHKTCAIGAALTAKRGEFISNNNLDFVDVVTELGFDFAKIPKVSSPTDLNYEDDLFSIITGLNDHDDWSRPRIAKWLESIGY